MPIYNRQCTDCAENFEASCRISAKDELQPPCPNCLSTNGEWRPNAPAMTIRGDRLMTHRKDAGFGEVLDKIKERNPRTPLATGRNAKSQLSDNL